MKYIFFILLYASQPALSQVNTDKTLVAWYTFDGNSNDRSGNDNNPIFNNTTPAADRFGNPNSARHFNGANNYIRIKNSSSLCPDEMTLVAIVKPMGFYGGNCHGNAILEKGPRDGYPGYYVLRYSPGEYAKDCSDFDTVHQSFEGAAYISGQNSQNTFVQTGTWYILMFTFNKENARIYVDGEMISSASSKSKIGRNKEDLFLGKKDNDAFPYWFNGIMDEIRIYKRALGSKEILDLYNMLSKPNGAQ
ncbi:MAG: LamG domain-containing protein [Chitinophagaceae bacterium]